MEQLISRKNTLLMTIGQRFLVSFTIVNNLPALSTKAIDLRISPHVTIVATWNNSKNLKDESFGVKHPKRFHKPFHISQRQMGNSG
jgi:hypothetical protein